MFLRFASSMAMTKLAQTRQIDLCVGNSAEHNIWKQHAATTRRSFHCMGIGRSNAISYPFDFFICSGY